MDNHALFYAPVTPVASKGSGGWRVALRLAGICWDCFVENHRPGQMRHKQAALISGLLTRD